MDDLKEVLSVAQADAVLEEINSERQAILDAQETRKAEFEGADVDRKEALAKESEEANKRFKELNEKEGKVIELRKRLEESEKAFSMENQLNESKVKERKENMDENMTIEKLRSTDEYRSAYVELLKTGNRNRVEDVITRAGLKSTDAGVPVPTIMQSFVETAWAKNGKFSKYVRLVSHKGNLQIPVEVSADDAVMHAEGTTMPVEESIVLKNINIGYKTIKKWISLTDELMALVDEEFLQYVADEIVYKVSKKLDDLIISGATTDKVVGILNDENSLVATIKQDFTFATHLALLAEIDFEEDLVFAMNRKTFFNTVMALKDSNGNPIYQILTDNEGKPRYAIGGYKVEFTDQLKAYAEAEANEPYMLVGYFQGYTLNCPNGKEVKTLLDETTLAREDKAYMLGKLLAGGAVTKQKAFAVVQKVSA